MCYCKKIVKVLWAFRKHQSKNLVCAVGDRPSSRVGRCQCAWVMPVLVWRGAVMTADGGNSCRSDAERWLVHGGSFPTHKDTETSFPAHLMTTGRVWLPSKCKSNTYADHITSVAHYKTHAAMPVEAMWCDFQVFYRVYIWNDVNCQIIDYCWTVPQMQQVFLLFFGNRQAYFWTWY